MKLLNFQENYYPKINHASRYFLNLISIIGEQTPSIIIEQTPRRRIERETVPVLPSTSETGGDIYVETPKMLLLKLKMMMMTMKVILKKM